MDIANMNYPENVITGGSAKTTTNGEKRVTQGNPRPDPEVGARPVRRRFSAEYKQRILAQLDACGPGETGALLRREGLYASIVSSWRAVRERKGADGLMVQKRGRKPADRNPLQPEVDRLHRELKHLSRQLKQAEIIIDVQKKLSEILGIEMPAVNEIREKP